MKFKFSSTCPLHIENFVFLFQNKLIYLSKRHGDKVFYKNGAVLYRGDQFHIDFLQILLDTDICLLPYNDHHLDKE